MTMSAYTGLPGSGKSYEVVNGPILRAVAQGRVVWTNIPVVDLGDGTVRVFEGEQAEVHWYLQAPPGALVVIDECWRYWPAGLKADLIPEEQKEWFAMHRHRTAEGRETDIILVTQDLSQIASFVRNLVAKTWRMRKLDGLGTKSFYRIDVYEGAVTGHKPPASQHISGWRSRYKPEGFKRYRSHTQGQAAEMQTVDGRGALLKRPIMLAIPLAIAALFAIPGIVAKSIPGAEEPEAVAPASGERSEPPPVRTAAPKPPTVTVTAPEPAPAAGQTGPKESKRWVLLGIVAKADGTGIAMLESSTGRRRVDLGACERTPVEWRCSVDGEVVTMWSGNGVLRLAQGSTYNTNQP